MKHITAAATLILAMLGASTGANAQAGLLTGGAVVGDDTVLSDVVFTSANASAGVAVRFDQQAIALRILGVGESACEPPPLVGEPDVLKTCRQGCCQGGACECDAARS